MEHDQRDAFAAHARKTADYRPGWHPILSAVEIEPGRWELVSQYGKRYAIVVLLEVAGERGYRAVTGEDESDDRELIGYFRSLRAAAMAGHKHWLQSLARPGGINGLA